MQVITDGAFPKCSDVYRSVRAALPKYEADVLSNPTIWQSLIVLLSRGRFSLASVSGWGIDL